MISASGARDAHAHLGGRSAALDSREGPSSSALHAKRAAPSRTSLAAFMVALLTAAALATVGAQARASPLDPRGEDWEGLSELVRMAQGQLGEGRFVLSRGVDLGSLSPGDALILVHPTRRLDSDELATFMRAGGRVVLLDDYGTGDGLLEHFDMQRIPLPAHPASMLRSNPALAIADSVGTHRVVRDVTRVATNHATGLTDRSLAPLLVVRGKDEPDVLLAVAGVVGKGRLLVVGDASIAMNAMLRYPGNRSFAAALLRYAADPDEGDEGASSGRTGGPPGKVYLLTDDFALTGRYGGRSAVSDALGAAGAFLSGLHHGMSATAAYGAALLVALGVILWAGMRAGRTHRATVPRFARAIPVGSQGGVAGHAASLAAAVGNRAAIMRELKSALEETLATRLGLDRLPRMEDLVRRVRDERLFDPNDLAAFEQELTRLARFEGPPGRGVDGVTDAELAAAAQRVRRLVAAVEAAPRGRFGSPP